MRSDLERRLEHAETLLAAVRLRRSELTDPRVTLLRRIVDVWSTLDLAGDPTPGPAYDTTRGRPAESAFPGASTAYARRILSRLNAAIARAVDEAETQLDGDSEPPPRCPSCSRSCRFTDRFCGRCGERLGQSPKTDENTADRRPIVDRTRRTTVSSAATMPE